MPELPEVETIRLGLESKIKGLKITDVQVLEPKIFYGDCIQLIGQTVENFWRRGKVLGINLSNNLSLMVHLKMSGQLIWVGKEKVLGGHPTKDINSKMPVKSTRVIFTFSDRSKLYFNDQRKFGWIKVVENSKLKVDIFLQKLGPEPLTDEFTIEAFRQNLLKHSKSSIKSAILDQTVVAGVGNIYASEALFLAKIHPEEMVKNLTDQEISNLHHSMIQSLQTGIKKGGSSKTHYVNAAGERGYFLEVAYVYDRENQPCKNCQAPILKIIVGGRGSYFCPNCQSKD